MRQLFLSAAEEIRTPMPVTGATTSKYAYQFKPALTGNTKK
jgi:hypothetical protein